MAFVGNLEYFPLFKKGLPGVEKYGEIFQRLVQLRERGAIFTKWEPSLF